jgi:hypothetical protein
VDLVWYSFVVPCDPLCPLCPIKLSPRNLGFKILSFLNYLNKLIQIHLNLPFVYLELGLTTSLKLG